MSIFDDIGSALADVGREAAGVLTNPVVDLAAGAVGGLVGLPQLGAGAFAVGNLLRGGNARGAAIQTRPRGRGALPRSFSTAGGILGRAMGRARYRQRVFYPPPHRLAAPPRARHGVPIALAPAPIPPPPPRAAEEPPAYRPPVPVAVYDDPAAHSMLATQLNIPISDGLREAASSAASANDGWSRMRGSLE